nr:hypothetical protein [Priestia megaterium]WEZ38957.1 hypothetical protein P5636_01370 [Priestia megaterium DSM 319]
MSYTGYLELRAERNSERTVIKDTYHYGAFKVARPIYMTSESPFVYMLHVGGGYVSGDKYKTMITVEKKCPADGYYSICDKGVQNTEQSCFTRNVYNP